MKHKIILLSLLIMALSLMPSGNYAFSHSQEERIRANKGTVGLISGGVDRTYAKFAWDLATVLDDDYDMRILPILGKGSRKNIEDLMYVKGIDIAIVQSDVLDFYRNENLHSDDIREHIRYIAKLYDEEVHLLARKDIRSVEDLEGKIVNFDTPESGTNLTGHIIFKKLGVNITRTNIDNSIALEMLRDKDNENIHALMFVSGKPVPLFEKLQSKDDLHLISLPNNWYGNSYVKTQITSDPRLTRLVKRVRFPFDFSML